MQQAEEANSRKCPFYFKYQMKIEFIPYIEQEIKEFLSLGEQQVLDPYLSGQILVVLKKRIKQIDLFFQKNWNDYRAHQILRCRKLMLDFLCKHHQHLALHQNNNNSEQIVQQPPKVKDQTNKSISKVILTDRREKQSPIQLNGSLQYHSSIEQHRSIDKPVGIFDRNLDSGKKQSLSSKKVLNNNKELSRSKPILATPQQVKSLVVSPQQQKKVQISTPLQNKQTTKFSPSKVSPQKDLEPSRDHTKSGKILPKPSPVTRKMTKEQYIAYLRSKKNSS